MKSPPPTEARRPIYPVAVEARAAELRVGDSAPMFSYMDADGRWQRSENLAAKGCLLIVFGAHEPDLGEMERLHPAFSELGVMPVVVLDLPARTISGLRRRLGLECPMLADPMRAIASLYNSTDPASGLHATSYFVLDESRKIRALRHGPLPPVEVLLASSARCLGRPLPPSVLSGCNE